LRKKQLNRKIPDRIDMHNHHPENISQQLINRLGWAIGLTLVIFFAELICGYLTNSLSLLSDAGHVLADVMALGLSLGAVFMSRLPANSRKTFGYHRAEILAALINGISLLVIAFFIFWEAYKRLLAPQVVRSVPMMIVAVIGLLANAFVFFRLQHIAHDNLNIKSAFLHVLGDMLASVAVIIGGLVMMLTGNYIIDPIISALIGLIILKGAYGVVREGINIILEGVPPRIDYKSLSDDITSVPGVLRIHDLHVWMLSSANIMLSVHVHIDGESPHAGREVMSQLKNMLSTKYNIFHSTIQFECACCEDPNESICLMEDQHESHH
jgi:cobalt-zinc-cadmium efflux system protein